MWFKTTIQGDAELILLEGVIIFANGSKCQFCFDIYEINRDTTYNDRFAGLHNSDIKSRNFFYRLYSFCNFQLVRKFLYGTSTETFNFELFMKSAKNLVFFSNYKNCHIR